MTAGSARMFEAARDRNPAFRIALRSAGLALLLALLVGSLPTQNAVAKAESPPAAVAREQPAHARHDAPERTEAAEALGTPDRLPQAVTTAHKIDLPGRALAFDAIAGAIELRDARSGRPEADVAFVAFLREGQRAAERPVTFAVNGGPGAGSAWLDLGALGPWRLPIGRWSPSEPPHPIANAETWLDFTDLVFIDPPGTGFSRLLGKSEEQNRGFYSVDGDIDALAVFVRKWLTLHGRLTSPKFLVGESYGGFRAPKLARRLQDREGIGLRGLVLVSPVLDFSWLDGTNNLWPVVTRLPTQAAITLGLKSRDSRALEAEVYAAGPYLTDLLKGARDAAALDRISEKVARYTGLETTLVRRLGGRIDLTTFVRERARAEGKVASLYDGRIEGFDAAPTSARGDYADPVLDAVKAPLATAMADLTRNRLGWKVEGRYEILNETVNQHWNWGSGRCRAEASSDLSRVLALDPDLRVLVTHGITDLATPYFTTKLLLDQLPALGPPDRLRFSVYRGGHMFYFDDAARAELREDARKLIEGR